MTAVYSFYDLSSLRNAWLNVFESWPGLKDYPKVFDLTKRMVTIQLANQHQVDALPKHLDGIKTIEYPTLPATGAAA